MCIRDRVDITLADRLPVCRTDVLLRVEVVDRIRTAGVENTCLLYTSDAADERSSVDLGGRRIIKKQKTKRAREPPHST